MRNAREPCVHYITCEFAGTHLDCEWTTESSANIRTVDEHCKKGPIASGLSLPWGATIFLVKPSRDIFCTRHKSNSDFTIATPLIDNAHDGPEHMVLLCQTQYLVNIQTGE
jgi:hypothetical protein